MAWFSGKVTLGNFPDFAGAVNKLSESVKNIEKNFDSALGLEEKSDATGSDGEGKSCSVRACLIVSPFVMDVQSIWLMWFIF